MLVATYNVSSILKLGKRRRCYNKILYLGQRNKKRFQKYQIATVKCWLIFSNFLWYVSEWLLCGNYYYCYCILSRPRRHSWLRRSWLRRWGGIGLSLTRYLGGPNSARISVFLHGETVSSMGPVFGSVAETKTSGSIDTVKVMELSLVEVEKLSWRLEILGEQFQQGTTEIVEAKNKEVPVPDFEGRNDMSTTFSQYFYNKF